MDLSKNEIISLTAEFEELQDGVKIVFIWWVFHVENLSSIIDRKNNMKREEHYLGTLERLNRSVLSLLLAHAHSATNITSELEHQNAKILFASKRTQTTR